jgi:DNA-binding response OmpR family regulator
MDKNDFSKWLILLAEDERVMRRAFAALLSDAGYRVTTASDGEEALCAFRRERPSLVVLDVMMPKMDGYETCRRIRDADADVPVLFLTALDTEAAELEGLGVGADDYIAKTAPQAIFLARVAAALRHRPGSSSDDFDFGPWRVAAATREMRRADGVRAQLSPREIAILRLLVAHPGMSFGRDELARRFWPETDVLDNTMNVCIHALREKLGAAGAAIKAIRGSGYAYCP